jgi:hypothetical protein
MLRRHSNQLSTLGGDEHQRKGPHFIFGIILTLLFMTKGEESTSRALMIPFFGDSCQKGGENEPKAKGPHHHLFQKLSVEFLNVEFLN